MRALGILKSLSKMFLSLLTIFYSVYIFLRVLTIFVIMASARPLIRTAATRRARPIQADSESESDTDVLAPYVERRIPTQEQNEENEPPRKKTRGAPKTYVFKGSFDNIELAKDSLLSDGTKWGKRNATDTQEGRKQFYVCVTTHGAKCPCRAYLLMSADSTKVLVFVTDDQHQHETEDSEVGIRKKTKEEIDSLYSNGVKKPQLILNCLMNRMIQQPKKTQLVNYLAQKRKKLYGENTLSLFRRTSD